MEFLKRLFASIWGKFIAGGVVLVLLALLSIKIAPSLIGVTLVNIGRIEFNWNGTTLPDRGSRTVDQSDKRRTHGGARLYSAILAAAKTKQVSNSIYLERVGKNLGKLYVSDKVPKALTVCVNWDKSTADSFSGDGFANSNSTDESKTQQEVIERSRGICEQLKAEGKWTCECTLIDLNGVNVLKPPEWWTKQFSEAD